VEVADRELLLALTGANASRLRILERSLGLSVGLRGETLLLQGSPGSVALAERVVSELLDVLSGGTAVEDVDVESSIGLLRRHPEVKLRDVFAPITLAAGRGKQICPRGLAQRHYVQAIRNDDVVFGVGPAGTGKTYLAMAMAIAALNRHEVSRVVLIRPAVEAGEKLGFLPGSMAEKVNPYLRPLYDALNEMMPFEKSSRLMERGVIEVAPLAFMRGRTLNDSFVILDEAQNTTREQMKMLLTRLGFDSKAVITGDVTQIDLPTEKRSGLVDATNVLEGIEGIDFIYFNDKDVVRHPLVQSIIVAYDRHESGSVNGRTEKARRQPAARNVTDSEDE